MLGVVLWVFRVLIGWIGWDGAIGIAAATAVLCRNRGGAGGPGSGGGGDVIATTVRLSPVVQLPGWAHGGAQSRFRFRVRCGEALRCSAPAGGALQAAPRGGPWPLRRADHGPALLAGRKRVCLGWGP